MRYVLIKTDTMEDLVELVQARMDNGWVPQGGIAAIVYPDYCTVFFQATVKEE